MLIKFLAPVVAIVLTGLPIAVNAQEVAPPSNLQPGTPPQPTAREVLEACVQNRAETLPNPYIDILPDHWAYKAVLTMHYCGAYRQATPPNLIEKLTEEPPTQQS